MNSIISQRAQNLGESVTLKMARLGAELKAKGEDIISMSLGEPDFDTPEVIKEAGKKAIDDNITHYSPVPGFPNLRQAIVNKFKRDNDLEFSVDQIVTSTGAKQSCMNLMLAMVNPGDEVIIPAPYWVSYIEMVRFAGGVPVVIETDVENDFKISPEKLEKAISSKTKAFLFSNPCNPSGTTYENEELAELVKVFEKHSNVYVISDEIYELITFNNSNIPMASFDSIKDRVITVNGVSKGFAMTGWRLGYIAAPVEVAKACIKIQGQFTSGACTISQMASLKALEMDPSEVKYMCETFQKRRDLIVEHASTIPNFKVNKPEGAFYLFPDVSYYFGKTLNGVKINDSSDFCMYLLEHAKVATTPGVAFGVPECIRLSYAIEDVLIIEAVNRIKKVLN